MKAIRGMQKSGENPHRALTIPAAEEMIEEALSELAYTQDPGLRRVLRFLAPEGYQPVVELCSENGRSKRRDALADSWSPEYDELRIYFERVSGKAASAQAPRLQRAPHLQGREQAEGEEQATVAVEEMDSCIEELCHALDEAERSGHSFIALKWFRDTFLPRKTLRWNQSAESRQAVLTEAIQRGLVLTSKIANPKAPAYPTTTIRLNRAAAGIAEQQAPRFEPVAVEGEPLSAAIEEERGAE